MAKQKLRNPYAAQLRRLSGGGVHEKTNKAKRLKEKQETKKEIRKYLD